jgi:hypothetical protein
MVCGYGSRLALRLAGTTVEDTSPRSRGAIFASGSYKASRPRLKRAQGMPGARRTHCLACKTKRRTQANTGTPKSLRHSLRNGLRLTSRSRRSTGLVSLRPPGLLTRGLIPASGDHDHTTWPSASDTHRLRAFASIAARTTNRDDRETPLMRAGWGMNTTVSAFRQREIFLRNGLDMHFRKTAGVLAVVSWRQHFLTRRRLTRARRSGWAATRCR